MFKPGTVVWVGWTPDERVPDVSARPFRCRVGVITDGPFPPCWRMMRQQWWKVEIDGHRFDVTERILFPFHEPDQEVCVDDCLEYTE